MRSADAEERTPGTTERAAGKGGGADGPMAGPSESANGWKPARVWRRRVRGQAEGVPRDPRRVQGIQPGPARRDGGLEGPRTSGKGKEKAQPEVGGAGGRSERAG